MPSAPKISFNFDDGQTPAGTTLFGNPDQTASGYITASGGVNDSGVLHVTDAANGEHGHFYNVQLPGFAPMTGASFGIGARTGGLNENQWIDNLEIATTTATVGPSLNFTVGAGGTGLSFTWGTGFWLQSTPTLTPINWTYVAGASSPLTVPTTSGALFYRLTSIPPPP